MKKSQVLPVLLLSILSFTACTKKNTAIVPYPSVSPSGTSTVDNTQNYSPYQQGVGANPDYYGNGTALSDDTSSFDNTQGTATQPTNNTQVSSNNGNTTSAGVGTDLGIPTDLPNLQPYAPPGTSAGSNGTNYALAGNMKVDQDSYIPAVIPFSNFVPSRNQWQSVGVAASGSTVIVSAFDSSGLLKKGTAITMNAETGLEWKNIGSTLLGTRHPMDATVKGITIDSSGKMYAVDAQKYIYVLSKANTIDKVYAGVSGGLDIAAVSDGIVVATSTGLKKYPSTISSKEASSPTELGAGVTATGGIGTDKSGNVYVVSSNVIKKVTSTGKVSDFTTNVEGAIDVAVNNAGKVFVLTSQGIILYDETGKQINSFGQGDFASPTAIASNGTDVFVSDKGSSYKTSQVVKYSILSL